MKHEVALKENHAVVSQSDLAAQMAEVGVSAADLAIPRIQLMQGTSDMVGEDKAKIGDMVNTSTNQVVGGVDRPIEIIPMGLYKTLVVEKVEQGKKPKFLRQEPLTPANDKLPWDDKEQTEDGMIQIKRTHCFNFFVLVSKDVEAGEAFPTVIRFKSTSMTAGRQLATHVFKRLALGQSPFSQAIELNVRREKKDTNTFGVFALGKARKSTDDELAAAQMYFSKLGEMKAKVDAIQETASEASEVEATVITPEGPSAHGSKVVGF